MQSSEHFSPRHSMQGEDATATAAAAVGLMAFWFFGGDVFFLWEVLLGLFRRHGGTEWCGRAAGKSGGACCP